ncbi:MAG: GNAT family N-acetyltransferase [Flavobacteriaceae bacterium]|nr:GNAT family N-acetyltransferase [Flavobacteriaceae bacterium]
MKIRAYNKDKDEYKLMKMIEGEGEEWTCYSDNSVSDKYRFALENSITYVAYEGDNLCGYSRSINDCGFYIYVCDLLVIQMCRGKKIGQKLMECLSTEYPNQIVYVMSDVDEYYKKKGFKREGSIYEVTKKSP